MVAHAERASFVPHRPHGACTEDQVIPGLVERDGVRGAQCAAATRERLGGTADPQARPAREESGAVVTSGGLPHGEKAAGISSLFSCRIGRTPVWGGHAPPAWRDASRTRVRSLRSLYTQVWTNLFSPPISLVQQATRGENSSRASMALLHPSSTLGMSPGAKV